jgi:hypothetical protein
MNMNTEAIRAGCEQLCIAFSYHLDHGDFESVVQLFAPNGVFVRNSEPLEGREAIREAYRQRPAATTMHIVSNFHLLECTELTARASVYNIVVFAASVSDKVLKFDPATAIRILEFHDRFVLTEEGWRFTFRDARPMLQSIGWPG